MARVRYMDKDSAKSLYFVVSVHTDESKCQNTAFLLVDIRSNLDSLLCTHMMRKRVFLTWLLKLHTTVFFIILYPPSPPDFSGNQDKHKNWVSYMLPLNLWLILIGNEAKKKFKMADSKKLRLSTPPILNIFSRKFQRLVLGRVG